MLPIFCLAQEKQVIEPVKKENTNFKNQIDLDVEVLSFSFGYKHRVSENWFLGARLGIGPLVSVIYLNDERGFRGVRITELLHASVVAKRQKSRSKWSFEVEPRYSITGFERGFYALSIGASIYFGKKVQVGFKLSGGDRHEHSGNKSFMSGNVLLRINFKK